MVPTSHYTPARQPSTVHPGAPCNCQLLLFRRAPLSFHTGHRSWINLFTAVRNTYWGACYLKWRSVPVEQVNSINVRIPLTAAGSVLFARHCRCHHYHYRHHNHKNIIRPNKLLYDAINARKLFTYTYPPQSLARSEWTGAMWVNELVSVQRA